MKKQLLAVVLSLALIGGTLPATFVQAQSAVSETEMSGTEKEGDKGTSGTEGEGDKETSGTEKEGDKETLGTEGEGDKETSGTEKEGDKETLGTEGEGDKETSGTEKEGDKGTPGTEGEDSKDVPEASGPSAGDGSANYAANSLPLIEGQGEAQGLTEEEFESLKTALAALPAAETVQELDEAKQQELYQELLAIEEKLAKLTEEQKAQITQEQMERLTAIREALAKADSLEAVYVSAAGDDENGDGTQDKPIASLAKAVSLAKDGAVIYVMSDLTMNASARSWDKHLTVKSVEGEQYTVTRGEAMSAVQDNARSTYNPAMFEANGSSADLASLRFENIILDDGGCKVGEYFVQADSDGDAFTTVGSEKVPNTNIVQDAIIATYNGVATITLGSGTILRNFGGMSAVRLSGGKLIMENGSVIEDTAVEDRIKGESGSVGPAGAVWVQGGTVTVKEGAKIRNMMGRAVYADGGEVTIHGTIQNMTGDKDMWQGQNGIAVHIRNNAKAVLAASGRIDTITTGDAGTGTTSYSAVRTEGKPSDGGYAFESQEGSVITNATRVAALYSNWGKELLNGTIENCSNDWIIGGFVQDTTIGETGVIEKCIGKGGAARAIVYTSNASKVFLKGTVRDNEASYTFYIINQSGGGASLTMYDGAVLTGKGSGTGVYINASESRFVMEGGTISNFGNGVYCRGKSGRDATFVMNGGTITDNNYGLFYSITGDSQVDLNGGEIIGNGTGYQIYASGGSAKDNGDYLHMKEGVVKENTTVYLSFGMLTFDKEYKEMWLGKASADATTVIKEKLAADKGQDWKMRGVSALWFKPTADSFHFTMPRPNSSKVLWAGYMELNADGTAKEDAGLTLLELDNDNPDTLDITLDKLTAGTSYGLILIEAPDLVIRPVNLTKYVTGDEVHEDGDYSNCFPEPRYTGIPDTAVIKVNGEEWIPEKHNNAKYPFDINYYELDENGNEILIKDDHAAGTYIAYIEPLAGLGARLDQITINDQRLYFAPGELTILAVSSAAGVENIENVASKVADAEPSEAVEDAVAVIKDDSISFLVNGLKGQTPGEGADIRLLHDEILTGSEGGDTYAEMMIEKLRSSVTGLEDDPSGEPRQFAMKYLDFIDANDSNVIVTPDLGYSWQQKSYEIYLPYPSGTDKTFEFRVFDFQGLERSYTADDYGAGVGAAIENSTVQELTDIERTDQGIKVTIKSGGRLGAMALSWQQKEYVIKAAAGEGGTISPSGDVRVRETADKTFTITPNAGYAVSDVKVDGKSIGAQTTYTFAGVTADHEILAEFARIRYTLTVENGSGDGTYPEGEKVTIKADKAPEGKVFAYWSSSAGGSFADEKAEQTVFTMPGGNVTVTAVYKDKAEPDKPEKPGTDGDSGDSGSSGGSSGSTTELGGKTPHTGDSSNIVLWSVLVGGSLVGLAAAWLYFRKREN